MFASGLWGPKCCQVAQKCSFWFCAGSRTGSFNCGGFRGAKYAKISLCMLSQPWLLVYNPHFSAQRDTSDAALSRKTESCVQSCATCTKLKTPRWASLTKTAFFLFTFEVWKGCWVGSWPFTALLFFLFDLVAHIEAQSRSRRGLGVWVGVGLVAVFPAN